MKGNKGEVTIYRIDTSKSMPLHLMEGIQAGFPSPAADYLNQVIDLNKELVKHPASTFLGRVCSDSMIDAGLDAGDILVIDKSESLVDGKIYVCFVDGEFTVKQVSVKNQVIWLLPANNKYKPIKVTSDNEFMIWGKVQYVIKDKR